MIPPKIAYGKTNHVFKLHFSSSFMNYEFLKNKVQDLRSRLQCHMSFCMHEKRRCMHCISVNIQQQIVAIDYIRDNSFITYAKFSEKQILFTP